MVHNFEWMDATRIGTITYLEYESYNTQIPLQVCIVQVHFFYNATNIFLIEYFQEFAGCSVRLLWPWATKKWAITIYGICAWHHNRGGGISASKNQIRQNMESAEYRCVSNALVHYTIFWVGLLILSGVPYGRTMVRARPNEHSQRTGPPSNAN